MAVVTWSNLILSLVATQLVRVIYTIVHRLVFSPLASVPGPRLAALTSWYECYYDVFKPGQYVFKIKQLHEEYGTSRRAPAFIYGLPPKVFSV